MIEMHIYGKLRKQSEISEVREAGVLHLETDPGETMTSALNRAGISAEEVHSIFLNAKLFAARSNMVRWLGYQQASHDPLAWDLEVPLNAGDRIGVFGRDMAALVV